MRALHLLKTPVGASWALGQMAELVRLGHEVHALLPDGGSLIESCRKAGIVVHAGQPALSPLRPRSITQSIASIRRVVSAVRPDVVHSHFVATTLAMRLALSGDRRPRIFQVPGPLHLEHVPTRVAELASAGEQDVWVASCRWTADEYIRQGIDPRRVFLSYYGLDVARFATPPFDESPVRALPVQTKVIALVAYMYAPKRWLGQCRGLKGHEDLIDALAEVARDEPGVVGLFAGGAWGGAGWYEERIRAHAARVCGGRVRLLGNVRDVRGIYRRADVAVHPSHSENVGGAVESLLLGTPTIATRVGGLPDLVIDGETGVLVPPRDPRALATAIRTVLSEAERYRELARRGSMRARELFDVRRTAAEIGRIYAAVAA
jgi:glycosyltransferase involved in cell wall biosynthesis